MATPSSSATTPSPRPRYLQSSGNASSSVAMPNGISSSDGEDRDQLAQRITAGAHLGELALSLRARLLYANFKVKSSATNATLHDLDSQPSAPGKHTPSSKRTANFFGEPGSPAGPTGAQSSRSAKKGSMAPPSATASAAQSLFSSLLAPPPAKRARTIHNADDPPVSVPEKAIGQTRSPQRPTKATRTPDSHGKSKSKKVAKEKVARSPATKGRSKGKQRVTAEGSFEAVGAPEREIDMEAAATLTTILLNQQRASVSVTAGSPRSSISAGSDPGSVHSFAQYAQSSARTAPGGTPARTASQHSLLGRTTRSTATPPQSPAMSQASPALSHAKARRPSVSQGSSLRPEGAGTPKMTPRDRVGSTDDTDAADMLLLMATSPSPARPTSTRDRDAKDASAFRALRSGSGLKGRVLFPSFGGEDGGGRGPRMLSREMSGSFGSVSSTATEPVSPRTLPASSARREHISQAPSRLSTGQDTSRTSHLEVPMLPTVTPPTPTDPDPSQLLPAVHSSSHHPRSGQPSDAHAHSAATPNPVTPHASFGLSDFVNVSPSPIASMAAPSTLPSHAGRRLFDDHHSPHGKISSTRSPGSLSHRQGSTERMQS